jgi:hypothetical protein
LEREPARFRPEAGLWLGMLKVGCAGQNSFTYRKTVCPLLKLSDATSDWHVFQ